MRHQRAVDTLATERYLLDEMPEDERFEFEEHYFSCPGCAEDVRVGAVMRDAVAKKACAGPGDAPAALRRPETAVLPWRFRLRPSILAPLAAAAGFALVAGYQTLFVVPALREAVAPQAVSPVVLRPQTRGEDPVVRVDAASRWLTLAVDSRDGVPGEALVYELKTLAGGTVASGRATVPAPGTPLFLLIPTTTITPGRYVLALRRASATSAEVREYAFTVVRP